MFRVKTFTVPSIFSRRFLSFKTLESPNPNALKFISPECQILPIPSKTFEFTSTLQAIHSPLALKLFKLHGVRSIMLGEDFLTVNKQDHINWAQLRPEVVDLLDGFLTSKKESVVTKELIRRAREIESSEDDLEIVSMIKELIETRIRPAIQDDGGDIEFKGFDEETGNVFLKLQGACKTCSSSEDTLKNGIEQMMKHYIDGVQEVIQILDPEEEIALEKIRQIRAKDKTKKSRLSSTFIVRGFISDI